MNKGALVLLLVLVLALSLGAFAFQNEPEGFRGLKWGDPPTEDMEYFTTALGTEAYTLSEDKMHLGNVPLRLIAYSFYEERFMTVTLFFNKEERYDLLKSICLERYEEPTDEGFYELTWTGQTSSLFLTYDWADEDGCLSMGSTKISMEYEKSQREKEAEKAAGDW